jgi:hypothetical protein
MDTLEAFNQAIFLAINGTLTTSAWLVGMAMLIADDMIYLIPLPLAGMWLWGAMKRNASWPSGRAWSRCSASARTS